MPFKTAEQFKTVLTGLSVLRYLVKSSGARGTTDPYKNSERFFEFILNQTYSWSLVNANVLKPNYPAIDLADENLRICVQVTGENSSTKIKKTIETFFEHNLNDKYDRLVFLILTGKKAYTADFGVPAGFNFEIDRDIIDIDDVLAVIEHKSPELIGTIADHVERELKSVMRFFAPENSLLTRAEVRAQTPPANARKLFEEAGVAPDEEAAVFNDLVQGYKRLTALSEDLRSYIYIALKSGDADRYPTQRNVQISPVNLERILRMGHEEHTQVYYAVNEKSFADIHADPGAAPMLWLTWSLGGYFDAFMAFKGMFSEEQLRKLIVDADFTLLDT